MSTGNNIMKNTVAGGWGLGAGRSAERIPTNPQPPTPNPRHRGSVLIMVVALLVLIALIATAMLSTSRSDRVASIQHEQNVQIDLLMQGAKDIAIATIVKDQFGTTPTGQVFRPGDATSTTSDYDPFDAYHTYLPYGASYADQNDKWLMPRTPTLQSFDIQTANQVALTASGNNWPIWPSVTAPLASNRFEHPGLPAGNVLAAAPASMREGRVGNAPPYTWVYARSEFVPTMYPGTNYPALQQWDPSINDRVFYIAADTDGDGIADSMLQRLPMGPINGVTYYVAYRIIDNNSAINVNTAGSVRADFANNGGNIGVAVPNLAIFPSNIGLAELLRGNQTARFNTNVGSLSNLGTDFYQLLNYRGGLFNTNNDLMPDGVQTAGSPKDQPHDDSGAQVNTYRYLTFADAIWHNLGRRPGNPGVATNAVKHQVINVSDTMSLAYPAFIRPTNSSTTTLDQYLPLSVGTNSTGGGMSTIPFSGDPLQDNYSTGRLAWYNNNFNWLEGMPGGNASGQNRHIRSIATSYNPVSNASAVAESGPGININYINATTGAIDATVALEGFGDGTPRASLNTAPFPALMRAYFSVMAENWTGASGAGSPFTNAIATFTWPNPASDPNDPYHGMKWTEPAAQAFTYDPVSVPNAPDVNTIAGYQHPARPFRSALRAVPPAGARPVTWGNTTPRLAPDQMVILRSAIAAANAKELRDNDDNIAPVEIPLAVTGPGSLATRTRIYGVERQPFISEVYVQTDIAPSGATDYRTGLANDGGYIAVELYNPYPFPIDLFNCKLMGVNRSSGGGYPAMPLKSPTAGGVPLQSASSNMAAAGPAGWSDVTIPPMGYLILENFDPNANPGASPKAAKYRPAAVRDGFAAASASIGNMLIPLPADPNAPGSTMWAYVPYLEELVYNHELMLLRPLLAVEPVEGPVVNTRRTFSPLTYTWTAASRSPALPGPAASDMAPLDSFDFTGLFLPNATGYADSTPNTVNPWLGKATAWHYSRPTPFFDNAGLLNAFWTNWHFVYPGRYNAAASSPDTTGLPRPRQQGVQEVGYAGQNYFDPGFRDPWEPNIAAAPPIPTGATIPPYPPIVANFQGITFGINGTSLSANQYASYPRSFPIQLNNIDQPGPYNRVPMPVPVMLTYPFGGFTRNGDALDAPFIGAYRIDTLAAGTPTTVLELNTVSMDAALAEDTDINDDPQPVDNGSQSREQIGRFCPLNMTLSTNGLVVDDDPTSPNYPSYQLYQNDVNGYGDFDDANPARWRYRWASDLLDYVTVQSPNDDYSPNVLPTLFKHPVTDALYTPGATAVSNSGSPAAQSNTRFDGVPQAGVNVASEQTEPIQGLININTANWQVLAMVPWFARHSGLSDQLTYNFTTQAWTAGADNIDDNVQLAREIVYWRDGDVRVGDPRLGLKGHGPFRSLYDLYRVPAFRNAQHYLLSRTISVNGQPAPQDPSNADGDLSPFNYNFITGGAVIQDNVHFDYEKQYLLFKRISNLLTTRSDAFTVYLVVQGWRNTGTANPELVVQRKAAMIVDRSRCSPSNPSPLIYNIPTQQ